jgi:hypothetical protein
MITYITFLTLLALPAFALAYAATKLLRSRREGSNKKPFVAPISTPQLAPGAIDYAKLPVDQLLAAAEEFMRTDPGHLEFRRQQQIKQENLRKARQVATVARKQAVVQTQAVQPQTVQQQAVQTQAASAASQAPSPVADALPQKPAKKTAKAKPTWEDLEVIRKKRESLPPLPPLARYSAEWFMPSALSSKIESSVALPQDQATHTQAHQSRLQDSQRFTAHPARPNLIQRTLTLFALATQRYQAMVKQTTRLAQSIPRIFNFLAPRFWRKTPPNASCAE